jgi:SAM-dependent methyltransferase
MLDVACGRGRHARLFADLGCRVDAVDIDPRCAAALADRPEITFTCADIENGPWPYGARQFDAVVVTRYLHRPLLPMLLACVAPGGMLLYETFAVGQASFGRPSNPEFLLRPGELLDAFCSDLHVLAYEDGIVTTPGPARLQRLAAIRGPETGARLRLDEGT